MKQSQCQGCGIEIEAGLKFCHDCVNEILNRRTNRRENRVHHIYVLVDPRDSRIHYVGRTHQPKLRLRGHLADARNGKATPKRTKWIQRLAEQGLAPVMVTVELCRWPEAKEREIFWIKLLRKHKAELYN